MKRCFPSLFKCMKADKPQLQASASERKVEYATQIGRVNLTWSKAITGISLSTEINLSNNASTTSASSSTPHISDLTDNHRGSLFDFKIIPSLPGHRRGLRQFKRYRRDTNITQASRLEFAWDFTNADLNASGDVQPASGYYFCIVMDGEMVLLLGDMKEEAHSHANARRGSVVAVPTSREETVHLRGCTYNTKVVLGGEEREFAVNFQQGMEDSMAVWIDRSMVVEVRTKWKVFEGSRDIDVPGGVIKIVWDRQEWTDRANTSNCSAAREFAIARLAVSFVRAVEGGGNNVENYFHLNLF